jgi:hypothetical protein
MTRPGQSTCPRRRSFSTGQMGWVWGVLQLQGSDLWYPRDAETPTNVQAVGFLRQLATGHPPQKVRMEAERLYDSLVSWLSDEVGGDGPTSDQAKEWQMLARELLETIQPPEGDGQL